MKKFVTTILLCAAVAVWFTGCSDDTPELSVDPAALTAATSGGNYSFAVACNVAWTAAANAEWITLSPASGNGNGTVNVTVAANATPDTRTATISIAAGDLARTVTVTQSAVSPELNVDKTTIAAIGDAGTYTIGVTGNTAWTATKDAGATWLSINPATGTGNGTVTVSLTENTAAERTAVITFASGTVSRTVTVTQAAAVAPILETDPTEIAASYVGGNYPVAVTGNMAWSVSTTAAWISLNPASGTGNGTVTLTVAANAAETERTAGVTFTSGSLSRTVSVNQEAAANTPPYAASTRTWTLGELTWSDYIQIPECNKSDYTNSRTEPYCRSNEHEGTLYYYYNYTYTSQNADVLCPSPWRLPEKDDFVNLDILLGGSGENRTGEDAEWIDSKYITEWGGRYGGTANSSAVIETGTNGYYWSSTAVDNNRSQALFFGVNGNTSPQLTTTNHYGFQVRCIK